MKKTHLDKETGVVIIGRNEGDRLSLCIDSLKKQNPNIVYVDSGSSDNSILAARNKGVKVVSLDMTVPFTAGRARNAGFEHLVSNFSNIQFVQFVDGDCEVLDNWLNIAVDFIKNNQRVAVVNGILYERFPDKSIYNFLCDLEWNSTPGRIKACGGNALMRVIAFKEVGGFLPNLIAGEEPELCVRLRAKNWEIWHLDQDMMLHDANILHFKQWWKRSVRAGYAFAEGTSIHGAAPEFHWVAESRRAIVWATIIPLIILLTLLISPLISFSLLLIYPAQILKITLKSKLPFKEAFIYALFSVLGKFPEQVGQFKFLWSWFRNKKTLIIEYK